MINHMHTNCHLHFEHNTGAVLINQTHKHTHTHTHTHTRTYTHTHSITDQVATNALLERNGARCALLITKGFRDLLYIGNQSRPRIFDMRIEVPDNLYEQVCAFVRSGRK